MGHEDGLSVGAGGGDHPSRRAFLRLAAAAGFLAPGLAGCRTARLGTASGARGAGEPTAGPDPVERGLLALSVAHRRGWLSGHSGAAFLAAHYFVLENGLDERTAAAVRTNAAGFVRKNPEDFASVDPGRGTADVAPVVEQLYTQIDGLHSGGHDVIYASLALRAFHDRPDLATPSVVEGVRRLVALAGAGPATADSDHNREHPLPPYATSADVATATLGATLQPWSHLRQIGTSGVLHWITHADALLTLEDLGYANLARRGHDALRLHVNHRAPVDDGRPPPSRSPLDWLGPEYWESDRPERAFQGTWLAGHSFKLPYSLFRLLRRTEDANLRSAALARAALLLIPFEG